MVKEEFKPFQNPQELVEWLEENDILMNLTKENAEILMNYMDGHGYRIGVSEGELSREDNCSGDSPDYDLLSIDEIIDVVCEWNYEMIQYATEKTGNPKNFIEFVNTSNYLDSLRKDEKQLDDMFNQTCFGKEIEELAQKLAREAIKNIKAVKEEKEQELDESDKKNELKLTEPGKKGKVR